MSKPDIQKLQQEAKLKKAEGLLNKLFDNAFNEQAFEDFTLDAFADLDTSGSNTWQSGSYIYEPFRKHISKFRRVSKYTDANGETLQILAVKVTSACKLERARHSLANFVISFPKKLLTIN